MFENSLSKFNGLLGNKELTHRFRTKSTQLATEEASEKPAIDSCQYLLGSIHSTRNMSFGTSCVKMNRNEKLYWRLRRKKKILAVKNLKRSKQALNCA